jgi:hypothetical protein
MWYEATEIFNDYGKKLLAYDDFIAAAFGSTEASTIATQPVATGHSAGYTSKWGIEQVTGCLWIWGRELGGPYAAAGWVADPTGRGSTYELPNAVLFGGAVGSAAVSGSRCSSWNVAPTSSSANFGARGRCDHLRLV